MSKPIQTPIACTKHSSRYDLSSNASFQVKPSLSAKNINAGYDKKLILHDISVDITQGSITALIGPNGAGKTTLLNILAGDLSPKSGQVSLNGRDITAFSAHELSDIRAVLPQSSALSFPFTVYEIVRLGVRDQRNRQATDEVVLEALEEADLAGYGNRLFQQLSGGEQQRVHLARVLAQIHPSHGHKPQLLFLDEPTANLDLRHQYRTMALARRFAQSGGAVIAILHDLNLTAAYADEIILLAGGRLIAKDRPAAVMTPSLLEHAFQAYPRFYHDAHETPFLLPPLTGA